MNITPLLSAEKFLSDKGWRRVELLGSGASGVVYLYETSDGKQVAVKFLDKNKIAGRDKIAALAGEIAMLEKLSNLKTACNEQVVCFHEFYTANLDHHLIVTEYIKGRDLKDILVNDDLDVAEKLRLMSSLVSAIEFIHSHGVVHRDIKPANIMVETLTGQIKLVDFGMGCLYNVRSSQFTCNTEKICGTPNYLAPEVWDRVSDRDLTKCDIYALGVVFYNILTKNSSPIKGNGIKDLAIKVRSGNYVIPDLSPHLPHDAVLAHKLHSRITIMMSYNPENRGFHAPTTVS